MTFTVMDSVLVGSADWYITIVPIRVNGGSLVVIQPDVRDGSYMSEDGFLAQAVYYVGPG